MITTSNRKLTKKDYLIKDIDNMFKALKMESFEISDAVSIPWKDKILISSAQLQFDKKHDKYIIVGYNESHHNGDISEEERINLTEIKILSSYEKIHEEMFEECVNKVKEATKRKEEEKLKAAEKKLRDDIKNKLCLNY